jgi:hypothetical protein
VGSGFRATEPRRCISDGPLRPRAWISRQPYAFAIGRGLTFWPVAVSPIFTTVFQCRETLAPEAGPREGGYCVAGELLQPPVNVLRLSLHPQGLAPRVDNLGEWRAHLLARLQQQIDHSGDADLVALHRELSVYPSRARAAPHHDLACVAISLRLRMGGVAEPLSFISTTTIFGTPIDVTLSELPLECFFPADDRTRKALKPAR